MTINIFVLKGDLNGKIVVVHFFFCRVYDANCENVTCDPQYANFMIKSGWKVPLVVKGLTI